MKTTIISRNYGSQVIDTETFNPSFASASSTVFKIIEHIFNDWFDHATEPGAPMSRDIQGMYNGEVGQPAIYYKRGAIIGGLEILIEEITERGLKIVNTRDIQKMDIECAFQ